MSKENQLFYEQEIIIRLLVSILERIGDMPDVLLYFKDTELLEEAKDLLSGKTDWETK